MPRCPSARPGAVPCGSRGRIGLPSWLCVGALAVASAAFSQPARPGSVPGNVYVLIQYVQFAQSPSFDAGQDDVFVPAGAKLIVLGAKDNWIEVAEAGRESNRGWLPSFAVSTNADQVARLVKSGKVPQSLVRNLEDRYGQQPKPLFLQQIWLPGNGERVPGSHESFEAPGLGFGCQRNGKGPGNRSWIPSRRRSGIPE